MSFSVAFYKVNHTGIQLIYSWAVRKWTKSIYSHCEIIFSNGEAASSSFMDGGVRFKQIDFDPAKWDFIDLPPALENAARDWFVKYQGAKYDLLGNLHFVISPVGDDNKKWFCSEAVAASLGIEDAYRFDPGDLYPVLKRMSELMLPQVPSPLAA